MSILYGAPRAKPVVPPQEYPPTPMGAEALRYADTKASEGYPPVAKSAEAVIPRLRISTDTSHAFIHGQSPWFLRRRIKNLVFYFKL